MQVIFGSSTGTSFDFTEKPREGQRGEQGHGVENGHDLGLGRLVTSPKMEKDTFMSIYKN